MIRTVINFVKQGRVEKICVHGDCRPIQNIRESSHDKEVLPKVNFLNRIEAVCVPSNYNLMMKNPCNSCDAIVNMFYTIEQSEVVNFSRY